MCEAAHENHCRHMNGSHLRRLWFAEHSVYAARDGVQCRCGRQAPGRLTRLSDAKIKTFANLPGPNVFNWYGLQKI